MPSCRGKTSVALRNPPERMRIMPVTNRDKKTLEANISEGDHLLKTTLAPSRFLDPSHAESAHQQQPSRPHVSKTPCTKTRGSTIPMINPPHPEITHQQQEQASIPKVSKPPIMKQKANTTNVNTAIRDETPAKGISSCPFVSKTLFTLSCLIFFQKLTFDT